MPSRETAKKSKVQFVIVSRRVFLTAEIWSISWCCVQEEVPQTFTGRAGRWQKWAKVNQSSKRPFRGRDKSSKHQRGAQKRHVTTAKVASTTSSIHAASLDVWGTPWPGSEGHIWAHLCTRQRVQGHECKGKSWSSMPWGWATSSPKEQGRGIMQEVFKTDSIHLHGFSPGLELMQMLFVQHPSSDSLRSSFQQAGKTVRIKQSPPRSLNLLKMRLVHLCSFFSCAPWLHLAETLSGSFTYWVKLF